MEIQSIGRWRRGKDGKTRLRSTLLGGFLDVVETRELPVHFVAAERRGLRSFAEAPQEAAPPRCTDSLGALSKDDRVRDVADLVLALSA